LPGTLPFLLDTPHKLAYNDCAVMIALSLLFVKRFIARQTGAITKNRTLDDTG
jgi:hypothetical protein